MKGGKGKEDECEDMEEAQRFGHGSVAARFTTLKRFVRTMKLWTVTNIAEFVLWGDLGHRSVVQVW